MALRKVALLVQQLQDATGLDSDATDAARSSTKTQRADTLAALAKSVVALCKEGGAKAEVAAQFGNARIEDVCKIQSCMVSK